MLQTSNEKKFHEVLKNLRDRYGNRIVEAEVREWLVKNGFSEFRFERRFKDEPSTIFRKEGEPLEFLVNSTCHTFEILEHGSYDKVPEEKYFGVLIAHGDGFVGHVPLHDLSVYENSA